MGFQIKNGVLEKYTEEPGVTRVHIPAHVWEIGERAFEQCKSLMEIIIPHRVMSIGKGAFKSCYNLRRIHLPAGITEIQTNTFAWCRNLTEVQLPAYIKVIGYGAFYGCESLKEIRLPRWLQKIDDKAFEGCKALKKLVIPMSVKKIGNSACCAAEEIKVEFLNPNYASRDGVLYDRFFRTLLQCPMNREKLTVPESVTTIEHEAFLNCEALKEVILPERLEKIKLWAFSHCKKLERLTIPANVSEIEDNPFMGCDALHVIHVASGNAYFSVRHGVLYSKHGTHIVHFPLDRKQVVLSDTVTEFPMRLSSGICEAFFYRGSEFTCSMHKMRFLLDAVINREFAYFLSDVPESVQYDTLWKLYRMDSEREKASASIQKYIAILFRWLIKQGEQAAAEEILAASGLDLQGDIGDLIVYANEQQQFGIQLMLLNYKNEHIGYDTPELKL